MPRSLHLVRCLCTAVAILMALATTSWSQTWSAAVSEMRLIDLPEVVDRGLAVPTGSLDSTAVLFWNASKGRMIVASSDSARRTWQTRQYVVGTPFRDVRVHDLDGDGSTELLLIDPPSRSIRIASAWTARDTVIPISSIVCPVSPTRVLITDATGDRLPDLILFDENEPGLQLLINRGHGRWSIGRPIAPNTPFRDAAVVYLNNDEIPDLIAYDWVRSEFHTLYGVENGRFLDQGIFRAEGTVDRLLMAEPRPDEPVRFLTVEQARGETTYWTLDESGELAERNRVRVEGVVRAAFMSSADADGTEFSLLLSGGRLARVRFPDVPGEPAEALMAGVPERSTWSFPVRRPDRSASDVVVIAPDRLTAVYLVRSHDTGFVADSSWWSVGVRPEAVETVDLDDDDRPELLVGNRGSRRLDVLWSQPLIERPPGVEVGLDVAMMSGRRIDSSHIRFLTVHPESRTVAIQDLDRQDFSVTATILPVQGTPEWASEIESEPAELAVVHGSSSSSIGVSLFEPIRPDTYLEHTLGLSAPSVLLGALVGDADGDGRPDLYMVYKPDDSSDVSVGIAFGDSVMSMRRRSLLQEFPFQSAQRAWIWSGQVNADSLPDLITVFPRTHQAIYVLPGRSDSLLTAPMLVDSAVRISSRRLIQMADIDGDGKTDIVAHVPLRGGVGWWKGDGLAGFAPWSLLVPALDVGGIAVADVTGDRSIDLILTRPSWGAVTIYDATALIRHAPVSSEGP